MNVITAQSNIGAIVANDYRSASVFKNHGIDYCCNGNRSIADACADKDLDTDVLIAALSNVSSADVSGHIDYKSWPLDLLADYIEKTHHRYVSTKIEELLPLLDKIVKVHGTAHPELSEIQSLFVATAGALTQHMKKEEMILFPFIRKMATAAIAQQNITLPPFGSIQNPIAMMHHEHDDEGERFRKIAALSNNYTPPDDACATYKVTFALLREFEADLHLHIHLENNILFPKSIMLENELQNVSH